MIILELPWPPTVNSIWRQYGKRTLISREYRKWKVTARNMLTEQYMRMPKPPDWLSGRIRVTIELTPNHNRQWDIDNRVKPVLDALEGLFYDNDNQIDDLRVIRREKATEPRCLVHLEPLHS